MLPVVSLLGVTAIWGWTFVVVRDAVHSYPVVAFLSLRFGLAALLLVPLLLTIDSGILAGILPGVTLATGYLFQTAGLEFTTASKAGLLTGTFVVMTPVLEFLIYRRRPRPVTVTAVFGALAGTVLLTGSLPNIGSGQSFGDLLEILTAVSFSIQMLLLGRLGTGLNTSGVALGQMLTAAVLFTAGAPFAGGFPPLSPSVAVAVLITGALASALAFWVQTYVQQRISPSRTALILAAEPAFAALFGVVLAGDQFTRLQALGAGLIFLALVVNEAFPSLAGRNRSRAAEI